MVNILGLEINKSKKNSDALPAPVPNLDDKPSKPLKSSYPKSELGDSGTRKSKGYILDDYNPQMRGTVAMAIYDEMRKSDGTVKALIQACTLPIRRANWFITAASEDQKDIDAKMLVENALFNWIEDQTWDDIVRQALLSLSFGVMVFEKVYSTKNHDGKDYIVLKKLAPRLPKSIMQWQLSDGSLGIRQLRQDGVNAEIPWSKLLVFINDREGDNYEGTSILRAAYKHWYYKNNFYKIDAIAFERQGVGVPRVKMPVGYTVSDEAKAVQVAKNLRTNEDAYAIVPDGYDIEFMDMKSSSTRDPKNSVDHHNREILQSGLAQFLDLGSGGGGGSHALSKNHSDLFLNSIEAIANNIIAEINKKLIPELVDMNFNDVTIYPKLQYSGISSIDVAALGTAYGSLITAGGIKPINADENYLRAALGLPAMSQEDADERDAEEELTDIVPEAPEPKDPNGDNVDDATSKIDENAKDSNSAENKKKVDKAANNTPETKKASEHVHGPHCRHHVPARAFDDGKGYKTWRPLTFAEKKVSFNNIATTMDDLEAQFERDAKVILQNIKDAYMDKINSAIADGDMAAVKDLEVKFANEYKQLIKNTMRQAYEYGKNNASTEMKVSVPTNSAADLASIDLMAEAMTIKAVADIESKGKIATVNTANSSLNSIQSAALVDTALNDVVDSIVINAKGLIVNESINDGRGRVFDQNSDMIYALQRSAVLDKSTCNFCVSMDGRVIEPTDPWAKVGAVHSGCRCIWVEILKDEENPPEVDEIPSSLADYYGGQPNDLIQPPRPMPQSGTLAEAYVKSQKEKK